MTDLFQFHQEQARSQVMEKAKDGGTTCPCCGQRVQVYRRKITSMMARQLIEMYRLTRNGKHWVHTKDMVLGGSSSGDFAKLKFWGLIEPMPHNPGDKGKKTSGYWKITQKGWKFVQGTTEVPKYSFVFNDELQSISDEYTDIRKCLDDKFDYAELMRGTYAVL